VWSFASGKTPEVNPRSGFTTGTPDTPEFFAEQKMRPNGILNEPPVSVSSLQGETLYYVFVWGRFQMTLSCEL
jgi:hypothetical protein